VAVTDDETLLGTDTLVPTLGMKGWLPVELAGWSTTSLALAVDPDCKRTTPTAIPAKTATARIATKRHRVT
jgi:hypothetical protein